MSAFSSITFRINIGNAHRPNRLRMHFGLDRFLPQIRLGVNVRTLLSLIRSLVGLFGHRPP
jgi:hypothetical protein